MKPMSDGKRAGRMSDLQDIISRLERVIQTGATDKYGMHPISAELVLEELKLVADRPSGEWEEYEIGSFRCSNCGCKAIWKIFEDNYCPNCGARMKGADDE